VASGVVGETQIAVGERLVVAEAQHPAVARASATTNALDGEAGRHVVAVAEAHA
jgi:hypothetical protein